MSKFDQPSAPIVLAGFLPGKIVRVILGVIAFALGGLGVLPFLLVILDGHSLDTQETWALFAVALFTALFAGFWLGFRSETAYHPTTAVVTDAWSFFGLGPRESYPLNSFHQIRIQRRFRSRIQVARIRFWVELIGTTPSGNPLAICLGSFLTMTLAAETAERLSGFTRLPIDFINNATPAAALEHAKQILGFPIRMHLAIARIGWWPLARLIRNRRKTT